MKWIIRSIAAAAVLAASVQTAQACVGQITCEKTADVTEITSYPATVNYTVTFTYSQTNDRCAIAHLSDSLLPPDFFAFPPDYTVPGAELFWVSNPPTGSEYVTYQLTIDSYDACKSMSQSPPAADGSVTLTNYVNGGTYFDGEDFSCEKSIVCRPPPTGFGCTLTPGYWKTHSSHGPAPYDATWANVMPSGADSPFFTSGQTWYQVLWTDSAGGNAYYILARAYIAAVLNGYAGASAPDEVDDALAWAFGFFNSYGPNDTLSKSVRSQALAWATILDNYNNGYIGPGHCQ